MTELENKIEQLPDGVDMVLYQRSLHPYCEPITTDEIKALLSELRRKTEALEHYADSETWQKQTNISILAREYANYTKNGYDIAREALASEERE